jgi:hypothetical protein
MKTKGEIEGQNEATAGHQMVDELLDFYISNHIDLRCLGAAHVSNGAQEVHGSRPHSNRKR